MKWSIEHTSTEAGEASYEWVRRYSVTLPAHVEASDHASARRWVIKEAKRLCGLTGVWCTVSESDSGVITLRPSGKREVVFASVSKEKESGEK